MKKIDIWDKLTENEKRFRFKTFQKNVEIIEKTAAPALDKQGRPLLGLVAASYKKGINKFAFLTHEEFTAQYLIRQEVLHKDSFAQSLRNSQENLFEKEAFEKWMSIDGEDGADAPDGPFGSRGRDGRDGIDDFVDSFLSNSGTVDFKLKDGKSDDDSNNLVPNPAKIQEQFEKKTENLSGLFDDLDKYLASSEEKLIKQGLITRRGGSQAGILFDGRVLQQKSSSGIKKKISWEEHFNAVFDQKKCNSCYASSSLNAIEALYNRKYPEKDRIYLSVQELLDCSEEDQDCEGGQPSSVMHYIKRFGVSFSVGYPYEHKKISCRAKYDLNKKRKKTGPRILEQMLTGRVLQSGRFSQNSRFSNRGNSIRNPRSRIGGFWNQNLNRNDNFRWSNRRVSRFDNLKSVGQSPRNNSLNNQTNAGRTNRSLPDKSDDGSGSATNSTRGFSSRSLKLDRPRREYYHEVVEFERGERKVSYEDLKGEAYRPSFMKEATPIKKEKPNPEQLNENQKKVESIAVPLKEEGKEGESPLEPVPEIDDSPDEEDPDSGQDEESKNSLQYLDRRFEEMKGFYFIKPNVVEVLKALQYGPVVIAHYVSEAFKFYESGIFNGEGCEEAELHKVNHASTIVGYDFTAPVPYFKLKNSWGTDWGEKGFYKMYIGHLNKNNKGICLMTGTPFMVFPYLEK